MVLDQKCDIGESLSNYKTIVKRMPIVVVYKNTKDYPGQFVARLWDLITPTEVVVVKGTLEEIRNEIPKGFVNIGRMSFDDPVIVESWI
jgi:hypothetical protein